MERSYINMTSAVISSTATNLVVVSCVSAFYPRVVLIHRKMFA